MNSIKGGHFVSISGVYKQHPAPRLEMECHTGAPSRYGAICGAMPRDTFQRRIDSICGPNPGFKLLNCFY